MGERKVGKGMQCGVSGVEYRLLEWIGCFCPCVDAQDVKMGAPTAPKRREKM